MKLIYYDVLKLMKKPVYEKHVAINAAAAHFETDVLFCLKALSNISPYIIPYDQGPEGPEKP